MSITKYGGEGNFTTTTVGQQSAENQQIETGTIPSTRTIRGVFQGTRADGWEGKAKPILRAGSLISAMIPIMLFLPLQKCFAEGITASGVKE